ncbi:BrnA antitoxin family protein [Acidithiobacillus sp. MC6.1]|nr:BrnA antitoxin family protein [Acidithiobacillus sp. MC6.1]
MKAEYDFSQAKRGAVVAEPGKTRVTIRIDNDVLEWFRSQTESHGGNYQKIINAALREQMSAQDGALERVLRRVIREEMLAS